jgi:hypothetical protein
MFKLIQARIPVRGAIAFGPFFRQTLDTAQGDAGKSVFLAGRPIIEAYEYEGRQDWVGTILAPTALEAARSADLPHCCVSSLNDEQRQDLAKHMAWKAYLQRCQQVPFHVEGSFTPEPHDGLAVVPGGDPSLRKMHEQLQQVIEAMQWLKLLAPTPREQRKYVATLGWLGSLEAWARHETERGMP